MRYRIAGPWLAVITALALVGCGGSTGGSPSAGAEATAAPGASSAPTTAAQTEAPPSQASASEAAPTSGVPNFAFPSTDKELEALLPDTLCGASVQKFSMGGDAFESTADPSFIALLEKVGKTSADVSFAVAAPVGGIGDCSAGIFRIKGADGGAIKEAFLADAVQEGTTYTQTSIGGKDVYVDSAADPPTYTYFKGDAVLFAAAVTAEDAASVLEALP